jgi:3-methyladenine DNA glycosylase AlkD
MTYDEAMAALKAAGSEPARKTYIRHGAEASRVLGVTYAELYKLVKRAGVDQALAEKLWASGCHDARVLATHVADPAVISAKTLDAWIRDSTNYILADAVSTLAVRTPHAAAKARAWTDSKQEYTAAAGWSVVAGLAMSGAGAAGRVSRQESPGAALFDDAAATAWLSRIEREIHSARNRVRHAMNNAVICIGLRGGPVRDKAIAAARRIGKVEVDHGDTGCKTPDAIAYIHKVETRTASKRSAPSRTGRTKKAKRATARSR